MATKPYAASTDVPVEKSMGQIQTSLRRFQCAAFQTGWQDTATGRRELISFEARGRRFRFEVLIPPVASFQLTPTKQRRNEAAMLAAFEQERRRLWRVLEIGIKAKLAAVESGVMTFEDEFLAYTVLEDNSTVGEWAEAQIERAYLLGQMPPMLPGGQRRLGPGK